MTDRTSQSSYFDRAYRDYNRQNPVRKLDHYLDIVEESVPSPADLLDIGCGLGAFLARTRQRHPEWRLVGTDIDVDAVEFTGDLVPDATVHQAGADETVFPAHSFDVVTAWDVLEHVEDLTRTRAAIESVLRPGGLLAFVVPVYDGLAGPVVRFLDHDETHIHQESRWFWLDWVDEAFQLVTWHGIFRYLLLDRWYIHWPTHSLRRHSPAILVTAKRR